MVDITYGVTNSGKTTMEIGDSPNAFAFVMDDSVDTQSQRQLGIHVHATTQWAHSKRPPAGMGVAEQLGKLFGVRAFQDYAVKRYGSLEDIFKRSKRDAIDAKTGKGRDLSADIDWARSHGIDVATTAFWQLPLGRPDETPIYASDIIVDEFGRLCRDAMGSFGYDPASAVVDGDVQKEKNQMGKLSGEWMKNLFNCMAIDWSQVNWTVISHNTRPASKIVLKNGGGSYSIYGGPELLTSGQIPEVTKSVSNSLYLRAQDADEDRKEVEAHLFSPVRGFETWLSYFPPGSAYHNQYQTKSRGPFWACSPSSKLGLYLGAGMAPPHDMTDYEWLVDITKAMLSVPNVTGPIDQAAWDEIWQSMKSVGVKLFKELRAEHLRVASENVDNRIIYGRKPGSPYKRGPILTRSAMQAQASWALHTGYAAWVSRRYVIEGSVDLF